MPLNVACFVCNAHSTWYRHVTLGGDAYGQHTGFCAGCNWLCDSVPLKHLVRAPEPGVKGHLALPFAHWCRTLSDWLSGTCRVHCQGERHLHAQISSYLLWSVLC